MKITLTFKLSEEQDTNTLLPSDLLKTEFDLSDRDRCKQLSAILAAQIDSDNDCVDDRLALRRYLKSLDMALALSAIYEQVFRPAFKHGYSDENINEAIEKCGYDEGVELIETLKQKYFEVLEEYGLSDLEDLFY